MSSYAHVYIHWRSFLQKHVQLLHPKQTKSTDRSANTFEEDSVPKSFYFEGVSI